MDFTAALMLIQTVFLGILVFVAIVVQKNLTVEKLDSSDKRPYIKANEKPKNHTKLKPRAKDDEQAWREELEEEKHKKRF